MNEEGKIHPVGIVGEGELDQLVATALNARFRVFLVRLINDLGLDFESVISKADHILAKYYRFKKLEAWKSKEE